MFRKHFAEKLTAYHHDELSAAESRLIAEHLPACSRCREESEMIKLTVKLQENLPLVSAPPALDWARLEESLDARPLANALPSKRHTFAFPFASSFTWQTWSAAAVAILLCITAGWYYLSRPDTPAWEVAILQGKPTIDSGQIKNKGRLAIGAWLETDDSSRAKIEVADIGHVEVEPNTRLKLVETQPSEHRLALERGTMHAMILAPPRLFFVDTPSAVAIDYGCAYTLTVDDSGASVLRVTAGWVALSGPGRESYVPADAACTTRPGKGPGTPYFEDSSEPFQNALASFDFGNGGPAALSTVLSEARARDTLTLWHLLSSVDIKDRTRVYDRLVEFSPIPEGVSREGIMRLDQEMLDSWKDDLEFTWF